MSAQQKEDKKKSFSADWLVQGVLTKLGDTFDRLTGRGWNPSSSLATSKLTEKLKALLDSEARNLGSQGQFVPHLLKLKMQWDKFSTDSEDEIVKLEHELHVSAIDHINDRRYHTYAPIEIEIQTDYFTEGVRLLSSFGKFAEDEEEAAGVNVTLPNLRVDDSVGDGKISVILSGEETAKEEITFEAIFVAGGETREIELDFGKTKRISVGRSKENGIFIDDKSVSKIHASLVVNAEKMLMVADTGSTNGTFVGGERIQYGQASVIEEGTSAKFGSVEVLFERVGAIEVSGLRAALENGESVVGSEANIPLDLKQSDTQKKPDKAFNSLVEEDIKHVEKPKISSLKTEDDELADPVDGFESSELKEKESLLEEGLDETQDWEI